MQRRRSRRAHHRSGRPISVDRNRVSRIWVLSAVFASFGLGLAAVYLLGILPLNLGLAAGLVLLSAVAHYYRPPLILLTLPALLPVLDLATWTGWSLVDEYDLFLASAGAGVYAGTLFTKRHFGLAGAGRFFLGLFALSFLISMFRGISGAPLPDAGASFDPMHPWNAFRVGKGFLWALLLWPALARLMSPDGETLRRWFVPGVAIGVLLNGLVMVIEKSLWSSLTDLASDYRPTALFSSMAFGGAPLDAWVVMSSPFMFLLVKSVLDGAWGHGRVGTSQTHTLQMAMLLLMPFLVALGLYSAFGTFSRSTWIVIFLQSAYLLAINLPRAQALASPSATSHGVRLVIGIAPVIVLLSLAPGVFASGGYRLLAAALLCAVGAWWVGGLLVYQQSRAKNASLSEPGVVSRYRAKSFRPVLLALMLAGGLSLAALAFIVWVPKGAYISFIAFSVIGLLVLGWFAVKARGRLSQMDVHRAALPMAAVWSALAMSAVGVGWHWGGLPATWSAILWVATLAGLLGLNLLAAPPLWRVSARSGVTVGIFLLGLGVAIPFTGSYYAGSRFGTIAEDMRGRIAHWTKAAALATDQTANAVFGAGIGAFPRAYAQKNYAGIEPPRAVMTPGAFGGNVQLFSGNPHIDYLRLSQRVVLPPDDVAEIHISARTNKDHAVGVLVSLCEKWMLYPNNCVGKSFAVEPSDEPVSYSVEMNLKEVRDSMFSAPWVFSIAVDGDLAELTLYKVQWRSKATGDVVIGNPYFVEGGQYWYVTSDREHLAWHSKQLYLGILIEQGGVGFVAYGLLLIYAFTRLLVRRREQPEWAAALLASIGGLHTLGFADTLIDDDRILLFSTLLLLLALARPRVRLKESKQRSGTQQDIGDTLGGAAVP